MRLVFLMLAVVAAGAAWLRRLSLMPATEFGGTAYSSSFSFTKTVDIANMTAVASVDTAISDTLIKAGDVVIAVPPATLEAGVAVQGCHTVANGSFSLRTTNASAGAINPASASWTFLVLRR